MADKDINQQKAEQFRKEQEEFNAKKQNKPKPDLEKVEKLEILDI